MAAATTASRFINSSSLTGIAAVQRIFLFLDGPAEVLCAATVCCRWRELATADRVWRTKAVREGIVDKAGAFEVALPAAAVATHSEGSAGSGEGIAGSSWRTFYAQVHVLRGYKMQDEDFFRFKLGERLEGGIRSAVEAWCEDSAAAKQLYGPIASWDTSEITDMRVRPAVA